MTQATMERDLVFGEIAVRNRLLSAQQLAECLRVRQVRNDEGPLDLPRLCVQHGYLSPAQAQTLVRASNFLIKHREDVEVAKILHHQRLVRGRQLRDCFDLQQEAYYQGALAIPRLLDILEEWSILPRDEAEAALARAPEAQILEEMSADSKSLGALLEPVSEDDRPPATPEQALSLPELLTGPEGGDAGHPEVSALDEDASPEECVRFRVEDLLEQLPEMKPEPVPFASLPSQQQSARPIPSSLENTDQVPRAFYRFGIRDSFVEYEPAVWLPFFTSRSAHSPLVDVSVGGLQFMSRRELKIGDKLRLDIHIPFLRRNFRSRGEVRWFSESSDPGVRYRIGVEFIRLSQRDAAYLKRLANSPSLCGLKRRND